MTDLTPTIDMLRLLQNDCEVDATQLDSTPFTPLGMGETFGNILAMIAAVAKAVETVAVEVESLKEARDD